MLYPLPAVLVTCGSSPSEWTMLTVAWTGIICSDPAMCYISVRPERASYPLIRRDMEFTINLTTADMAPPARLRQMEGDRTHSAARREGAVAYHRGVARVARMPREIRHSARHTRYVHSRDCQCPRRLSLSRPSDRGFLDGEGRTHGLFPRPLPFLRPRPGEIRILSEEKTVDLYLPMAIGARKLPNHGYCALRRMAVTLHP